MTGILLSVSLILVNILSSSSGDETKINNLFIQFLIISAIIALLIGFLVIGGAIIFRSKVRPEEVEQIHGNIKLEIIWTVIPILLVSYFLVVTIKVMAEINKPVAKDQQPDIEVIAHQWWWDMRYLKQNVITANELHIPVGKHLLVRIESADVIHDWWVPALGRKIDAIPGQPNNIWIEADKPGEYQGACSEYCGAQHAWMRILVVAESQEKFDQWISSQQALSKPPVSEEAKKGAELFQQKTCPDCHAISGTDAASHIGPDLSHIGSRETLFSGMKPNTPDNLSEWLTNPQKVKDGAMMPNFIMSKEEVNELTTYLEGLK